ncbi:hypothetical protein K2173_022990 [Erythroxylum novogranatense]|uniref:Tetratricopeptide repeat protein 33 n=1 Tax=Erythroxylum novogranatense TaxID=1862640 RepID=A0AAV8T7U1_9ROSI|nr:hypothetical protein K2173_022990 [Erythroxylum novogranatense]
MKVTWKKDTKKRPLGIISKYPNLPFDQQDPEDSQHDYNHSDKKVNGDRDDKQESFRAEAVISSDSYGKLAQSFQAQGNELAEEGKYQEALMKWEASLNLIPENAILHEQKAQVLLELGDAWNALKAATRATEMEPSWAEAWITLGRAQLNFGEPDGAIDSFDRALAIKPDSKEAQDDKHIASQLVRKRKQLHSSGLSSDKSRYVVGDKI